MISLKQPEFKPSFDGEAAVAAVLYIAFKLGRVDLHRMFKILYVAEKDHLARYGRTIVGDQFNAMNFGPVPITIYNSLCAIRGDNRFPVIDEALYGDLRDKVTVHRKVVISSVEPDLDALSRSDVEALDRAIEKLRDTSFTFNTDVSHDNAWERARERYENAPIHLDDIIDTLEDGELLREHLRDPYPGG